MSHDPRISFFDQQAPSWDEHGPPVAETIGRLEVLRDQLPELDGCDVLEAGCGTGNVTQWLQDRVGPTGSVTAVDFSPEMVSRAGRRCPEADVQCIDLCSDHLGEASYDVVWCMHCLPHLRDQPRAIANMTRSLRPGGLLLVLHLLGREKVNAIHDRAGGAIAGDHLPSGAAWPRLADDAQLILRTVIDRDDLYMVIAQRPA
jgi:SAM-dependent methyltransferase